MGDFWRTRGMSFDWLRFLVCVFSMRSSFQYSDKGTDGNYWTKLNYSVTLNMDLSYSVKPYPNNCACHDRDGKIYNLAPLQNTDWTPSFTVESKKYPGYSYSYNPCSSFTLGPKDDGCQRDVAICWYVPEGLPDTYKTIGSQRRVTCQLDKQSKIPILVYHSSGEFRYRQANVKFKCDESKKKKHEAIFEIFREDEWIFQLTHLCACGDGCPINPMKPTTTEFDAATTSAPFDPMRVVIPVVASAGTVGFLLVPFLVWRLLRRQNNNDENERRRLLGNGAVEQVHNPIEVPAGRSEPVPVALSRGKADVNVGSAQV